MAGDLLDRRMPEMLAAITPHWSFTFPQTILTYEYKPPFRRFTGRPQRISVDPQPAGTGQSRVDANHAERQRPIGRELDARGASDMKHVSRTRQVVGHYGTPERHYTKCVIR
jgi:hypothetical protein